MASDVSTRTPADGMEARASAVMQAWCLDIHYELCKRGMACPVESFFMICVQWQHSCSTFVAQEERLR